MRARHLEKVQQRFAQQQHRVVKLCQIRSEVQETIYKTLTVDLESSVDPILSQQRFQYIQFLKRQIAELDNRIAKEETILETIREEMRQAYVGKKSLELLKEKQEKKYHEHIRNQEMKEIEDIVVARLHRSA